MDADLGRVYLRMPTWAPQRHRLREIGVIKKLVASYRYYPTKIGRAATAALGASRKA